MESFACAEFVNGKLCGFVSVSSRNLTCEKMCLMFV